MRILFTRFPLESTLGGAEIQTLSLMEGLIARGHEVSFAGSCPTLLRECKKRKIPAAEWDIGPPPVTKIGVVTFGWRKFGMRKKLHALFHHFKQPDVIFMLSLSEKMLLTDIAVNAGTNVIWVEHDRVGNWLSKNPWLSLLLTQSQNAMTITVSELSKKIYVKLGWNPKKVIAIPNGVSPKSDIGYRITDNGKLLRLGCIARLSHEKGIDVLIKAMTGVPHNTELEIVGTGREEWLLKQLTHTLGLEDRVIFTPHESTVGAAFTRWDALVLPSRDNDPFGMVAAEAMLAGLPVIVTDQCGIADYLEDGKDALIVKANSASALTDAINKISSKKQLGEHGRKTAEKKFSVERMVEEYEKVMTQKNR